MSTDPGTPITTPWPSASGSWISWRWLSRGLLPLFPSVNCYILISWSLGSRVLHKFFSPLAHFGKQSTNLKVLSPFCRPKNWSSMDPVVYWRGLLLWASPVMKTGYWLINWECLITANSFRDRQNIIVSLCRPLYCIAAARLDRYKACVLWVHVNISNGAARRVRPANNDNELLFWSVHCSYMYMYMYVLWTLSPSSKWTHNS